MGFAEHNSSESTNRESTGSSGFLRNFFTSPLPNFLQKVWTSFGGSTEATNVQENEPPTFMTRWDRKLKSF